ncbi:MAG TPA: hypothetical protein VIJ75_07525 [Hanamia sp.]
MAEKKIITNPSMGSNKLGEETDEVESSGISAGSDTQLMITALGGKKHRRKLDPDDEKKKEKNKAEFLARNKID